MKKYMAKVHAEQHRCSYKSGLPFPRQNIESCDQIEDLPKREKMRRPWYHNDTRREDYQFSPLLNFLASRVGRCWNDVWSEICEHNRQPYNFIQHKLREHLSSGYLVETNIILKKNGQPRTSTGHKLSVGDFWVHPLTGNLMQVLEPPQKSLKKPVQKEDQTPVDKLHKYVRVNGIWYFVEFAELPVRPSKEDVSVQPAHDVILHVKALKTILNHKDYTVTDGYKECRDTWGAEIYAISKLQAGKKELKQIRRWLQSQEKQEQVA